MKTPTFLRFVCLVCAWTSTLSEYVKVHQAPGERAPGIKGCFPAPVPSYTVRLQSLKTSGGSVYTRQLVTTVDLPCFENSGTKATLNATNIANCAEATAKKGLNSFSWENGTCTAYLAWRPRKRMDCKDGGSKVVYVVEKPLTPFGGGKIIVSGKMNYDSLPKVFLDISSQYDFCGFSSNPHKGYKLLINGSHVVMLPEGSATYNMSLKKLCSASQNISLWSVGADGKVNSNEVQVYTESNDTNLYGLTTGGCVYDSQKMGGYYESLEYCKSIASSTLFFEKVDGEASAFLAALNVTTLPQRAYRFYVGLRWVAEGRWKWLGGLSQSSVDTIWSGSGIPGTYECARASRSATSWRLFPEDDCNAITLPIVCYFPNP